jgi:hypothetical protein
MAGLNYRGLTQSVRSSSSTECGQGSPGALSSWYVLSVLLTNQAVADQSQRHIPSQSLPTLLKVDDALALMPVEYHRVRLHALNRWLVRDTSKPISSDNILGFLSPAVRWADHDPVCLLFILHAVLQTLKPPVAPDAPGYRLQRLVLDRIRETQQEWPALTQRHPTFAPKQSHAEACSEARTLAYELKPVLGPASAPLDAYFKEKAA